MLVVAKSLLTIQIIISLHLGNFINVNEIMRIRRLFNQKIMRTLQILLFTFYIVIVHSQSLTIDETINYINDLSIQSAGEFQIQDC